MNNERPKFLSILCFLSFVNGIYGVFSGLSNAIVPPEVDETTINSMLEILSNLSMPTEDLRMGMEDYIINTMLNAGNLGAATFMLSAISLIGVYQMYNFHKIGFFLYTAAQICFTLSAAIFGGFNSFGLMTLAVHLLWNFIWIGLYGMNYKHLH